MNIHLAPITAENWKTAIFLTTDPTRNIPLDEEWITSNAFSLLQTHYDTDWDCRIILAEGQPVGFVFYGYWREESRYLLCRYMIDVKYQGNGYGKAALPIVVNQILRQYNCSEVYVTVDAANLRAVKLYRDFGFEPTGDTDETEQVYVFHSTV